MHAELMDFNVVLQQTLCQKDALLERLKSELESLRGPMPSDSLSSEEGGNVNVWIPSAFLTGKTHFKSIRCRLQDISYKYTIYRSVAVSAHKLHCLIYSLKELVPILITYTKYI